VTRLRIMSKMRLLFLAAVSTSFVCIFALEENQHSLQGHNDLASCGFELVWPPSNSIVLLVAESLAVEIILKVWGSCSEFMRPVSPSRTHLKIAFFGYPWWWSDKEGDHGFFELITFFPLSVHGNISSAAVSNSRLLFQSSEALHSGNFSQVHWDIVGSHDKSFSLWGVNLKYSKDFLHPSNHFKTSDLPNCDKFCYTFELHLLSDLSTPVTSVITWPVIKLRLAPFFGMRSSNFHPIAARYSTMPGYVCLSACGKNCTRHSSSLPQSLLPNHSPVCTPLSQAVNFTLPGPSFTLSQADDADVFRYTALNSEELAAGESRPSDELVFVSVGGTGSAQAREISVSGPGRHRLLSVIAAVLSDSVGFIFLKTVFTQVDHAHVLKMIHNFDVLSSYPFIAFRHRRLRALDEVLADGDADGSSFPLPPTQFGSIHEGILVSRAAALIMLNAAMDEFKARHKETLPAPCSEFLIFSDAWLCWCAAVLDISAIDYVFGADSSGSMKDRRDCAAKSPLYGKLVQLYEHQRLSTSHSTSPPFTERTTLGFRYFMQSLAFHLVSIPSILQIPDNEQLVDSFFVDACCGQLLVDEMRLAATPRLKPGLHPLLLNLSDALSAAPNRSAFVAVMRSGMTSSFVRGRESVNSSMSVVRRRLRSSVSATRVLGCSAQNKLNTIDNSPDADNGDYHDGLLHGREAEARLFRMHLITPAVMLSRLAQPVSRALVLATHSEWTDVFGYNPVFSKDASLAFAAPDFGIQDWHFVCMLAVSSAMRSAASSFDELSREHIACNSFASAIWQRNYDKGMLRCFDLPPNVADPVRYAGSVHAFTRYWSQCHSAADEEKLDDDPWMLRQLARALQALLLERWDVQQVRLMPHLVLALL
jgi:hypothetical protein